MESLLVSAAQKLSLEEPYQPLWEPLFDHLVCAVADGRDAPYLEAVEAHTRLIALEGSMTMEGVFAALRAGIEALRGVVLASVAPEAAEASRRLLRLEGEALLRAGVGYADGLQERLDHVTRRVEELEPNDPLTGALKATEIHKRLVLEVTRCQRMDLSLGAVALAVEAVVELERGHGRSAADEFLKRVGRVLLGSVRPYDHVGRTKDGEFLILLPDVGRSGLASAMERIRRGLINEQGAEEPRFLFALTHLDYIDIGPADIVNLLERGLGQARSGEHYCSWM